MAREGRKESHVLRRQVEAGTEDVYTSAWRGRIMDGSRTVAVRELEGEVKLESFIDGSLRTSDGADPGEKVITLWEGGDGVVATHLGWRDTVRISAAKDS